MAESGCRYECPLRLQEAVERLKTSGGEETILAGGVALGILMNEGVVRPTWIVDISRIPELRRLELTADGAIHIGAAVSHHELGRAEIVKEHCPLLAEMVQEIACGRVQNRGTVGGNICLADPQGDPPAALLALDAVLKLQSAATEREVPISEFFKGLYLTALHRGEILKEIVVPSTPANAGYAYGKFGARQAMDYSSTIGVAVSVATDDGTGKIAHIGIGMSGVAPTPVKPRMVEAAAMGQQPDGEWLNVLNELLQHDIEPIADSTFSDAYKRHVASVLLGRTLGRALARCVPVERRRM